MGLGRMHEAKRLILGGEYFFSAVTGKAKAGTGMKT